MSLHDELLAAAIPRVQCTLCLFLSGLSEKDRDEWEDELTLPNAVVSHASVRRVLEAHGTKATPECIATHRKNH